MNDIGILGLVVITGWLISDCVQATQSLFPGATVIHSMQQSDHTYLVPLGRVKYDRDVGRNRPTQFERVEGEFRTETLKLPDDVTISEAVGRVADRVKAQNQELLFFCEKRDCGESFSWANDVFQQATLYGNDRTQSLWVAYAADENRYQVYYLIQRPNKKTYLHGESLTLTSGKGRASQQQDAPLTTESVNRLLQQEGRLVLASIDVSDGKADYSSVVKVLQAEWVKAVRYDRVLVLHQHGKATDRALVSVEGLAMALKQADMTIGRIEDVADLAPNPQANGAVWVEWVNPDWMPAP